MRTKTLMLVVYSITITAPHYALAENIGPQDIKHLAAMKNSNKSYFDSMEKGVARFSGSGIVRALTGLMGPEIHVQFENLDEATCTEDKHKVSVGEHVFIQGTVGGIYTAEDFAFGNSIAADTGADKQTVRNLLFLLTDDCTVGEGR